jgi:O-antigen/teichoic acid export membrane protein
MLPLDFIVHLRVAYLMAWFVCLVAFGYVVYELPRVSELVPILLVVAAAHLVIASVSFLSVRSNRWRSFVLRDSATIEESRAGVLLLTTLGYLMAIHCLIYAWDLWQRR